MQFMLQIIIYMLLLSCTFEIIFFIVLFISICNYFYTTRTENTVVHTSKTFVLYKVSMYLLLAYWFHLNITYSNEVYL